MNYRLVSKVLGILVLLIGAAMTVCVAFSYLEHTFRFSSAVSYGMNAAAAITVGAGCALVLMGRGSGRQILRKDAIAIVGLGWLVAAFFGSLPFVFAPPHLTFPQAYFESMSGFTTTGSSVIRDLNEVPHTIILWRAVTQWLGGIGILVLFVAVLTYLGAGSKTLVQHESSAQFGEGSYAKIHDVALALVKLYLSMTLVGVTGLIFLGMSAFDAFVHMFAAISTGGFSSRNESVIYYASPAIELWLSLFMLLGGVNFILMAVLVKGRWNRWKVEEEAKVYLGILITASLAIGLNLTLTRAELSFGSAMLQGWFQVVSVMTTTGFASVNFDAWPEFSRCLIIALMFIGGCAGSTSGGIKVSRVILFWKIMRQETQFSFRPNLILPLKLNGNPVDEKTRARTLQMIALFGFAVAAGTIAMTIFEPTVDLISAFTAVTANLCNIGPGLGRVGPMSNFADLSAPTHLLLAVLMVLGRLEFYAVLALFVPSLWKQY